MANTYKSSILHRDLLYKSTTPVDKLCDKPNILEQYRLVTHLTVPFSRRVLVLKVPAKAFRLISLAPYATTVICSSSWQSLHISTRHPFSTSIRNNFSLQQWPWENASSQLKRNPLAVRMHHSSIVRVFRTIGRACVVSYSILIIGPVFSAPTFGRYGVRQDECACPRSSILVYLRHRECLSQRCRLQYILFTL